MNKKLEETISKLEKEIIAARPNMKACKELLYSNEETGTVVYKVSTSNMSLPHPVNERIEWSYFLVGNNEGSYGTGCYVSSESHVSIGKPYEDKEKVVIPIHGSRTVHFGLQIPMDDEVFYKKDFKPYSSKKTEK